MRFSQPSYQFGLLIALFAILLSYPNINAATPTSVNQAVSKATAFLLNAQKNGNWEDLPSPQTGEDQEPQQNGGQWGGLTALATYSLLCAGVPTADPHLIAAVDFLVKTQPHGTYSAAARCMVWSRILLEKKTKIAARRDFHFLLDCMRRSGEARGMFHYGPARAEGPSSNPPYDHSASQFAVLGIWSLSQSGFEVDTNDWRLMNAAWRAQQYSDGSWSYYDNPTGEWNNHTASMTAAGVATLFIIDQSLGQRPICSGNPVDKSISAGIDWLADNFDSSFQPIRSGLHVEPYTLFGLSRIGASGGLKYLRNLDWFAAASDWLVKNQQADGSWITNDLESVPGTSFGLLSLSYGRAPVVLNKLQYNIESHKPPAEAHWNQRPQDCLNFVNWLGKSLETRLNWQIVTLSSSADDLQSAPILFISGDELLNFTAPEKAAMKRFVEDGGMILGNADCGSTGFPKSFFELAGELFPDYRQRVLPQGHPIYTDEQFASRKWNDTAPLLGVSNGVRELMLLPKADLGQSFQRQNDVTDRDRYQLASNIVLYAIDKTGLKTKGESFVVKEDPAVAVTSTVEVARLRYSGNWDPEPGGWRRFAAVMHNQSKLGLNVEPVEVGGGILKKQTLAHLTGTGAFKLTDAQRTKLKQYVSNGGTLCIDAAGGSTDFAASAEAELVALFGSEATTALASPLPLTHPLFNQPQAQITSAGYRAFARQNRVGSINVPRICGIENNGRIVAFYSREDLSAGLVGEPIDGIIGYNPATATALMRNIVLYAMSQHLAKEYP